MNSPAGPFFVAPHAESSAGVDYLGLRAINLSMMATLFPGINNVVSMVRPFSLIAWVCWKYAIAVDASGKPASNVSFKKFREKVEVLFVWSHVQAGDAAGLAGVQQHDNGRPYLNFQFAEFRRTASLLDAVQYGPSLKSSNGLEFIFSRDGFFKVTPYGQALAEALDASLRANITPEAYTFLCSVDDCRFEREPLEDIVGGWSVGDASDDEKQAFSERFYRPDDIGAPNPMANRSTMIRLVMEVLRENESPMTADGVRRTIACEPLPDALLAHPAAVSFESARRAWQLLQVRQAQRLGLEALFGWLERCLLNEDVTSVEDAVTSMLSVLARDAIAMDVGDDFVRKGYEFYRSSGVNVDGMFSAGRAEPEHLDLFAAMGRLEVEATDTSMGSRLAMRGLTLLLQCAAYADAFRLEPFTKTRVDDGPAFRIPLGHWGRVVEQHLDLPLRDFLRKMMETFLVSQHLGVAASRSSDERSRMRLSVEDRGLTSLLGSFRDVLQPVRSQDRLGTAMALMADCGLIQADFQLRYGRADVLYRSSESVAA